MTSASVPIPGQPRPREEDPPALRRVITRNMLDADGQEGVGAFVGKRKPRWDG